MRASIRLGPVTLHVPIYTALYAVLIACIFPLQAQAQTTARCTTWAAKLESVEGQASVRASGASTWTSAQVGHVFCYGDSLRITEARAALLLENDSLVRLKKDSLVKFIAPKDSFWLELVEGAAHFISRTPKDFTVKAPYMNAAVEGTEFIVSHTPQSDSVTVLEGVVNANNAFGSTRLTGMQQSSAGANTPPSPGIPIVMQASVNWVLHYPPLFNQDVSLPDSLKAQLSAGRYAEAAALISAEPVFKDNVAAQNLLSAIALYRGDIAQATEANQQALQIDANSADAQAVAALMVLVAGHAEQALTLTSQLLARFPSNAKVLLAHSYSLQAAFDLNAALATAQQALAQLPNEALLQLRVTELAIGVNKTRLAKATLAQVSTHNAPATLAQSNTLKAVLSLQNNRNRKARRILQNSLAANPNNALSHFMMGLADIRLGNLNTGRAAIELAVMLDPSNSLYRSYLGKAYFYEHRNNKAADQFALAKQLDPNDPTPVFYEALLKQSENRLVEAVADLNTAATLNDNRAVYRSRLVLDKDAAARSASQARLYKALNFNQLAIRKGTNAISEAPSEFSGHRLLAEAYADKPNFEALRASERLQATLLAPLGAQPLPLGIDESGLRVVKGAGPGEVGINEYNSLFVEEGLHAHASVLGGSQGTRAYDWSVNGLAEQVSMSLGQYAYQSDGFRANNDVDYEITNLLVQYQPIVDLGLQVELRRREEARGDIALQFDLDNFSENLRVEDDVDTVRVGANYRPTADSNILVSYIEKESDFRRDDSLALGPDALSTSNLTAQSDIQQFEVQYSLNMNKANLIVGAGNISANTELVLEFGFDSPFGTSLTFENTEVENQFDNVYFYSYWPLLQNNLMITAGASFSDFSKVEELETADGATGVIFSSVEREAEFGGSLDPKVGIEWLISPKLTARGAFLRTVSRSKDTNMGIEPTLIAGFGQVFDEPEGIESELSGVGFDLNVSERISLGVEYGQRDLELPVEFIEDIFEAVEVHKQIENEFLQLYYYQSISDSLSISMEYDSASFNSTVLPRGDFRTSIPRNIKTETLPINLSYTVTKDISIRLGANFVKQEVLADSFVSPDPINNNEEFWTLDLSLDYKLPYRIGLITIEGNNLLGTDFSFRDYNFFTTDPRPQKYLPEASFLVKLNIEI
ncbi:MAG: putative Zn-dependent protease [Lentisphaeria bacterium]|jgi:predicted Zn-dependent protease